MGWCILNGRLKFAFALRVIIINQECQNLLVSAKSKAGVGQRLVRNAVIRRIMDIRKDEKKMGGPEEPPTFT